jgi:MYXO-CTERM domain-containing protein
MNNVIVGTGQAPAGSTPIQNQPPSGWTNNVVTTGSVSYFTAPTGTNPSFVPAASASNLLGQGMSGNGAPTNDVGFDPKCLVKRTPVMVGEVARASWWQYDIDIDYIKSIGGVAKCFNPGARAGAPDIGAYKAGAVTAVTPGTCMAPPIGGSGGMGGMGGMPAGGAAGTGVVAGMGGTMDAGGAPSTGGAVNAGGSVAMGGSSADAGAPAAGGAPLGAGGLGTAGSAAAGAPTAGASGTVGVGGTAPMGSGGTGNVGTGGTTPTAGAPGAGGTVGVGGSATTGGVGGGGEAPPEVAGCGCRLAPEPGRSKSVLALGLLGLGVVTLGRRRRARRSGV